LHVTPVVARAASGPAFERAEALLPVAAGRLALNEELRVRWARNGSSLWYARETAGGRQYVRVLLPGGEREPLFDHGRLAAAIEKAVDNRVMPSLPALDEDTLSLELRAVETTVDGVRLRARRSRPA